MPIGVVFQGGSRDITTMYIGSTGNYFAWSPDTLTLNVNSQSAQSWTISVATAPIIGGAPYGLLLALTYPEDGGG